MKDIDLISKMLVYMLTALWLIMLAFLSVMPFKVIHLVIWLFSLIQLITFWSIILSRKDR